ncbi:hypothetical protein OROMI_023985 [Orobanche minor]
MSTISSYLVLVLLCFTFRACNARTFGAGDKFKHSITKGSLRENEPEKHMKATEDNVMKVSWRVLEFDLKKWGREQELLNMDYTPVKRSPPGHN